MISNSLALMFLKGVSLMKGIYKEYRKSKKYICFVHFVFNNMLAFLFFGKYQKKSIILSFIN